MKKNSRNKLAPMEMQIMQICWKMKSGSIREIQEALPNDRKVEYTTVQTIVYRLEKKGALKRTKKIGNAHIFEPALNQKTAIGSLVDDFLALFGGSAEPVMSHFIESGKLTLEDLKQLEGALENANEKKGIK